MTTAATKTRTAKAAGPAVTDSRATLGALLRRPYDEMSTWLYTELAASGFDEVRPAFSAVLRHLPADGTSVTDLAHRAGMTKQSMGYLVDQMAEAGLVAQQPDAADRRAKIVTLTERGQAALDAALVLSQRCEDRFAGLIGRAKLKQLRTLLAELSEALG